MKTFTGLTAWRRIQRINRATSTKGLNGASTQWSPNSSSTQSCPHMPENIWKRRAAKINLFFLFFLFLFLIDYFLKNIFTSQLKENHVCMLYNSCPGAASSAVFVTYTQCVGSTYNYSWAAVIMVLCVCVLMASSCSFPPFCSLDCITSPLSPFRFLILHHYLLLTLLGV